MERITGKCEIRWCKSGETLLKRSSENIGDGCFSVYICTSCFKMFGAELPEPAEVERKCKERYEKGDDCDVCKKEMPLNTFSALFGVHPECFEQEQGISVTEVFDFDTLKTVSD